MKLTLIKLTYAMVQLILWHAQSSHQKKSPKPSVAKNKFEHKQYGHYRKNLGKKSKGWFEGHYQLEESIMKYQN